MIQLAKKTLSLWEKHLKDPIVALAKALECLENPYKGWHVVHKVVVASLVVAVACNIAGAKILQKMWEGPYWEGVWPCLDLRQCALAHSVHLLERPREAAG